MSQTSYQRRTLSLSRRRLCTDKSHEEECWYTEALTRSIS